MKTKTGIIRAAPFLLVAIVPACGGGGNAPIAMENACVELQKAYCGLLDRCQLSFIFEMETHASCEEFFDFCGPGFQRLVDSVTAGRMSYNDAQARQCINSVKAISCEEIFLEIDDPSGCDSVFTGLVAQDAACYFNDECADGLYCNSTSELCPGTCLPIQSIGSECDNNDACDREVAECSGGGFCVELADAGESCEHVSCRENLNCDWEQEPHVCVAPGAAGADCTDGYQCQAGLRCVGGECIGPATNGQVCRVEDDYDELYVACQTGLFCDLDIMAEEKTGTCRPRKNQGEECILFMECKDGLLCLGVTFDEQTGQLTKGHCGAPLTAGSTCNAEMAEYFTECRYDHLCNPQTSKCELLPGEGDACREDDPECRYFGLYCDPNGVVCRQKKADGQACLDDVECQSNYCQDGFCEQSFECSP